MKGPVMSMSMCRDPSNSKNQPDKDLPPVTLITGKSKKAQWCWQITQHDSQQISKRI